jgi:hypothetical protein
MKINCPHGYKAVMKLAGNITWEDRTVTIYGGVCDTANECGITTCKFYDVSPAGDAKFKMGLTHEHSLEGIIERKLKRH